jgi:selenocysteine lyase/cysteine desulfurase
MRTMEGRVPTFCFDVPGRTSQEVATYLGERDIAVWWGNYYALETIRHLGLDEEMGAVRVGIVHYNTAAEIDRLLAGLMELV